MLSLNDILKLFLPLLFVCAESHAGTINDEFKRGLSAAKSGNFAEAVDIWKPLAKAGHSNAQYMLGYSYERGKGLNQDTDIAFVWYKLSASSGNYKGQYALASLYAISELTNLGFEQAYAWAELSLKTKQTEGGQYLINTLREKMSDKEILNAKEMVKSCADFNQKGCILTIDVVEAKSNCKKLGFAINSEKHGNCMLKMMLEAR